MQLEIKMPAKEKKVIHSKGEASRSAILHTAAKLATIKGLDGLSIGDLATEVGMSKSGLYAHFKSKLELDLATIDMAAQIFQQEVLTPAMQAPVGLARLRALCNEFLSHVVRHVFPGGCFFASIAMELNTRPGPTRDRVIEVQEMWFSLFRQCFLDAQEKGEIQPVEDLEQCIFETDAMLLAANFLFTLKDDKRALKQAQTGIEHILARIIKR